MICLGDIEIEKYKFHYCKYPINIKNVDIDKITISNRACFDTSSLPCFIGYKNDAKNKALCIILQKMSAYTKIFDETKYMSCSLKDDKLLKKIK